MPREALKGSIFLRGVFLFGLDYGLVSLRRIGNGLVWLFSIPVYSPGDKRGKIGVLEIAGLDSRLGLIMEDFCSENFSYWIETEFGGAYLELIVSFQVDPQ
jgi:hypothetical protein